MLVYIGAFGRVFAYVFVKMNIYIKNTCHTCHTLHIFQPFHEFQPVTTPGTTSGTTSLVLLRPELALVTSLPLWTCHCDNFLEYGLCCPYPSIRALLPVLSHPWILAMMFAIS